MQKIDTASLEKEIMAGKKLAKVRAGDFGLPRSQSREQMAKLDRKSDFSAQNALQVSR
jgi:hypothetical protein